MKGERERERERDREEPTQRTFWNQLCFIQ